MNVHCEWCGSQTGCSYFVSVMCVCVCELNSFGDKQVRRRRCSLKHSKFGSWTGPRVQRRLINWRWVSYFAIECSYFAWQCLFSHFVLVWVERAAFSRVLLLLWTITTIKKPAQNWVDNFRAQSNWLKMTLNCRLPALLKTLCVIFPEIWYHTNYLFLYFGLTSCYEKLETERETMKNFLL